jgi:hypothetical protein
MAGRTFTACPVEQFLDAEDPPKLRWRAQFTRRQDPGSGREITIRSG